LATIKEIKRLFVIDESDNITILSNGGNISFGTGISTKIITISRYEYNYLKFFEALEAAFNSCKEYILFPTNLDGGTIKLKKNMSIEEMLDDFLVVNISNYDENNELIFGSIKLLESIIASIINQPDKRKEACKIIIKRSKEGMYTKEFNSKFPMNIKKFRNLIIDELKSISDLLESEFRKDYLLLLGKKISYSKSLSKQIDYIRDLLRAGESLGYSLDNIIYNIDSSSALIEFIIIHSDIKELKENNLIESFPTLYRSLYYLTKITNKKLKEIIEETPNSLYKSPYIFMELLKRNMLDPKLAEDKHFLFNSLSTVIENIPAWPVNYAELLLEKIKKVILTTTSTNYEKYYSLFIKKYGEFLDKEITLDLVNSMAINLQLNEKLEEPITANFFKNYVGEQMGVTDFIYSIFTPYETDFLTDGGILSNNARLTMLFDSFNPDKNYTIEEGRENITNGINALMKQTTALRKHYVKLIAYFMHSRNLKRKFSFKNTDILKDERYANIKEFVKILIEELSKTNLRDQTISRMILYDKHEYTWMGPNLPTSLDFFCYTPLEFMTIVMEVENRRPIIDASILQAELN